MLDHVSTRRVILGVGPGLGRVEFEGFGVDQEDSRQIWTGSAAAIFAALEKGCCQHDGKFVEQERRCLREPTEVDRERERVRRGV